MHVMTTPFLIVVNDVATELDLELHFNVIRGRPADMIDPEDPDSVELADAFVIPNDPYFKRGRFDTPNWLWQILVDSESLAATMMDYALDEKDDAYD